MKRLALLASLLLTACQGGLRDGVVPYSAEAADALSRDESACTSRGFMRDSEAYLNCLRKLGDDEGYWLLVTANYLNFIAKRPASQPLTTPFVTAGGRLATNREIRPKDSNSPVGSQPLNLTGTWNILRSGAESCSFQQSGNLLSGSCKTLFVEGPVIGSIEGQRVGWRWLYQVGDNRFNVELFAGILDSENSLHGVFQTHRVYDEFHPTFEYQYSTPTYMRLSPFFHAERQSSAPA